MKWISVDDKLPKQDEVVLVFYGKDEVRKEIGIDFFGYHLGDRDENDWNLYRFPVEVTHWMPLPKKPIFGEVERCKK